MNARILKLATAVALVASLATATTAFAGGTRWTGADYCAVKNAKGEWALVGGASCNKAPTSQPNASWVDAIILDFTHLKTIDAYTGTELEDYDDITEMLTELTANHATAGWMYVANKKGNQDAYVYNMVKISSCSGNSDWAVAPACP